MRRKASLALVGFLALVLMPVGAVRAEEGVSLIVHQDNPTGMLTLLEVRRIYRGTTAIWPNGEKIQNLNLREEDPIRKAFSEKMLHRSVDEMERYYFKRVLSGKGQPPLVLHSSAEVLVYVRTHPNAIGYLDPAHLDKTVKVMKIEGGELQQ